MAESISALVPLQDHEGRQHDRTHMFVAATLYSGSNSCPVNIRNMSLSGALIEGAVLPARDASITLRRGSLQAAARIVWAAGRKAGVAFCAAVQVGDWMSRTPPSHQARVDEILRGVREGVPGPAPAADSLPVAPAGAALEAELKALQEELAQLETGLTNDMNVVASHPEIQLLDIALQRVGRLLAGASRF